MRHALLVLSASAVHAATATQPNIVFIFTDDQRFDTIAALGNRVIQTPHLDRLARRGVSFRNHYIMGGTWGAVCVPSRNMMLTGRTLFRIAPADEPAPATARGGLAVGITARLFPRRFLPPRRSAGPRHTSGLGRISRDAFRDPRDSAQRESRVSWVTRP